MSDAAVPLLDLARQASALEPELTGAAARVLSSGAYVLGPEVETLEDELARMVGVAHAVGVASGTDALHLALRAAGIGRGDLVLTSPFTFFATISAILATGAEPVFADIAPDTFAVDPAAAAEVMEGRSAAAERVGGRPDRIRAVVPVHLYGHPAPMDALSALAGGLPVVEDAAQAFGASWQDRKAGALGLAGCFSFFPTKNLGGYGDGGLVTTDDDGLADRLRLLRAHGARPRYTHHVVGTNSRLDALQAALLRVKLPHLGRWLVARRAHAAAYGRDLAGLPDLVLPSEACGAGHAWHQYTVRVTGGRRDALRSFLADRGIATAIYYPAPAHVQPALASRGYRRGDFPVAEEASRQVLSLPLFPELRDDERSRVVAAVREGLS